MPRYIDTDVLKEWVENWLYKDRYYHNGKVGKTIPITELYDLLEQIPTVDVVEIKKDGEWEMFDLISSAYYGKSMYFKEDNGIVYSRYSHKYMSVDEAIQEFVSLIDGSEIDVPDRKVGEWVVIMDEPTITFDECKCSECGAVEYFNKGWKKFNYCPNCGVKMEGERDGV